MTRFATLALPILAALCAAPAAEAHETYAHAGQVVRIQCYRGPWEAVIWDHARSPFVQDLQRIGYSPANADAIANDLCRDERLVGRPGALKSALHARMRHFPPDAGRR